MELAFVLFVAFGAPMYLAFADFLPSLFSASAGIFIRDYARLRPTSLSGQISTDLRHLGGLLVCAYVLARQGRSFRTLGLRWSRNVVWLGLALTGGKLLASHAVQLALRDAGVPSISVPGLDHYLFGLFAGTAPAVRLAYSAYLVVHLALVGLFEEMIVRAYLMTEVAFLTGSLPCAILVSVAFQTAYHLYQGWPAALCVAASFSVTAVYYASTGRATPVVLAHMFYDLQLALREVWG